MPVVNKGIKMKRSFLFALAIVLTACSTTPTQVTVTTEVTVTLPPPTNTPEPTSTPEPALPAEVVEAQKYFADKGFEITPEGKVIDKTLGKEISELTIVLFDENTMINRGRPSDPKPTWALQRVYEFEDKTDFTVKMTLYDITIEDAKIDMFGWIYENGEFTRQTIEFSAPNNGIVEIEGYSPEEVQYMIMINSSINPEYRVNSPEALRQMAIKYVQKTPNGQDGYIITYMGMAEPTDRVFHRYGNNFIPVLNTDGSWSSVETTEFMVYPEFKDRNKALVIWIDKDDKPVIVVLEGKYLEMPKYFNKYWETHAIEEPFKP